MKDFGKYKIKKQIGIGGTASVYLVEHKGLDRDVILKVMSDSLFSHEIDYCSLFVEEAQIIAKLNHPNIVQVYDINSSKDLTYIEMEFLSGGTLKERINKNKRFEPLKVIREIATALQYVFNTIGIIHRDIKPSNILFREDDGELVAVLSDFGIAKTEETDTEFTNIGVRVGTPRYMSPEQLMGGVVDQRSDLYSLGIILYEMLSGEQFNRGTTPDLIENFKTPKLPVQHKKLQPILNKLSAPNPSQRYDNADQLIQALLKFKDYQPLKTTNNNGKDNITNAITSTFSKLKEVTIAEPVKKPQYMLYGLILAINMAGGAYVYLEVDKKDKQRSIDIEKLEVSLLSLQQNEIDSNDINKIFQVTKRKYPNDQSIKAIGDEIYRISQKNRRRSLLDNASQLVIGHEYELAKKQLSLVISLSPSDVEKDEVNLIRDLIKNKKKRDEEIKARNRLIELENAKRQEKETIEEQVNEESAKDKLALEQDVKVEVMQSTTKIESQEQFALDDFNRKYATITSQDQSNCHTHNSNRKTKSVRHCHPNPKGTHNYTRSTWNHTHPAIYHCTNSINHTHKYKNKKHTHKYKCVSGKK